MGRGVGDHGGGICGLLSLLDEHQEAVEYDLIALGLRLRWLGTEALTWCDLRAVVQQAPWDSALMRAVDPDMAKWLSPLAAAQLAHSMEHTLRWLQWAKTEDAQKRRNAPKPIPAPWLPEPDLEVERYGGTAIPWDEMTDWLGW